MWTGTELRWNGIGAKHIFFYIKKKNYTKDIKKIKKKAKKKLYYTKDKIYLYLEVAQPHLNFVILTKVSKDA